MLAARELAPRTGLLPNPWPHTQLVVPVRLRRRHFAPWPEASGQWISDEAVEPVEVTAMGNLIDAHRVLGSIRGWCPTCGPLVELVKDGQWDFSCIRLVHALPPAVDTQ
jgi:hypothetical protein